MEHITIKHQRGDIDPSTGLVFIRYDRTVTNPEVWWSPDRLAGLLVRDRALSRKRYAYNPASFKAKNDRYRVSHRQHIRDRNRRYDAMKRHTDNAYRLKGCLRHRIWLALNSSTKSKSTEALLGCSTQWFKSYLEELWQPGMNWDNYGNKSGQWSIDHREPCSSFDMTNPCDQEQCFHYSNMQPLWHVDNLIKYNKTATFNTVIMA